MPAVSETIDRSTLMLKAFADPTRLRLLNLLHGGERCVCELVEVIGEPQPKISRHLAYLRRAGLVRARKEGLWVHYRLTEPTGKLHRRLIECIGGCLAEVAPFRDDLRRLKRGRPSRGRSGHE